MQLIRNINQVGNDIVSINDKWFTPWCLAASFQNLIKFHGEFVKDGILHFQFSPKAKVEKLISQVETKTEPHIPALDFMNAVDTFWRKVNEARNERKKSYGETKR